MEGQISFKKTTHNAIFIRWHSLKTIRPDSRKITSPVITSTIDGFPVSIFLSIECEADFLLRIHQNLSRAQRGIAFVAIKDTTCRGINLMKTYFMTEWGEICTFRDLGILMKGYSHTLTIDCHLMWFGVMSIIGSSDLPISPSVSTTAFADNRLFSDFTIIVEGQELPAHRAVLARHSSIFLTMFETPMKELKENKVIIEDIEFSTMESLLKILYTGNTGDLNDVDVILKVLHAAEKYQISTIKDLCECKLQLLIDKNNVLKLLEIGDKYHALQLCETCIAYILAIRNEKISMEFRTLSKELPNIGSATAKVLMDLSSLVPYKYI